VPNPAELLLHRAKLQSTHTPTISTVTTTVATSIYAFTNATRFGAFTSTNASWHTTCSTTRVTINNSSYDNNDVGGDNHNHDDNSGANSRASHAFYDINCFFLVNIDNIREFDIFIEHQLNAS
jgi:hypothetical protein